MELGFPHSMAAGSQGRASQKRARWESKSAFVAPLRSPMVPRLFQPRRSQRPPYRFKQRGHRLYLSIRECQGPGNACKTGNITGGIQGSLNGTTLTLSKQGSEGSETASIGDITA